VGLAGGVFVLLIIDGVIAATRATDWVGELALGLSGSNVVAVAISARVTAVIAVVKGERSIILLGPLLFGAFWAMFVLGEFLSPG